MLGPGSFWAPSFGSRATTDSGRQCLGHTLRRAPACFSGKSACSLLSPARLPFDPAAHCVPTRIPGSPPAWWRSRALVMPSQQPAVPSTSPPKPSRSLSSSLCALFSDADSGSGMKAELAPRPGVSEGARTSYLPCQAVRRSLYQLHSVPASILVPLYFLVKPGDFYRVLSALW